MRRIATIAIALLALLWLPLTTFADKVHLKDGRVLEGVISREGDAFIYITYKIGELERTEFILRANIERIERDEDDAERPEESPKRPPAGPATTRPEPTTTKPRTLDNLPPGTQKIAFITLEEMVGPYMNAKALKHSVSLLKDDKPDIVVLQINSGGGFGDEVQKLSDVIQFDIKPKYRVVAWIESAISAAAMTAVTCEEIYMMREGNIGAATGYYTIGGRAVAVKGEELEKGLRQMDRISRRGNHDPLIMRAMQVPTNLSCDIDAAGRVTWRNDLDGQFIVSTDKQILTLNAPDAVKYGLARAIAADKHELARAMGFAEWIEVGHEADRYQQELRKNVQTAQVRAAELLSKMEIALNHGNIGRARNFLGQVRGWVRRAPTLAEWGAPDTGIPPLNDEFFRRIEERIEEIAKDQATRRR